MSHREKFENLNVVELPPTDLDEVIEQKSRWASVSRAVTGVAGGVALASGVVLGSFAMTGIGGPSSAQGGLGGAEPAFANEVGEGADDAFGIPVGPLQQKVRLSSGAVVVVPVSDPLPAGAVVIEQPTASPSGAASTSETSNPQVIALPPVPAFDTGNTSSATPSGGTGGGGSSYDDDDDDEHEDHHDSDHKDDHKDDHEDEDDD